MLESPRWRKVARDVWLHKSRTILVVLAIAIGIVGAGTVLNTWTLMRRVTRDEFLASNPASATLRTDSVDAAFLSRVRALDGIAHAQARRTVLASARTPNGWRTAVLMASGDFAGDQIGAIKPGAGQWPPGDGAVVLEQSSREFAGAGEGDTLAVQLGDGPVVPLPVAGIARDVGLAPGWMENVVYLFVTPATLARIGAPATLNELQIAVRDRSLGRGAVRRLADDVRRIAESSGHRVAAAEVPEPGRHIHAPQIDSLLYTQGAFGLLALLLSAFLVVNLVSAMLTGQLREIGIMKAIGARADQVAGMYLGLALLLGLAASAIALPLAAALGRAYAEFTAGLLNFDVAGIPIPRWSIWLQLGVSALLPVAAASFPVFRGALVTVADALRDVGMTAPHAGGRALFANVGGASRPLLLSLRNAFRKRQRMLLTLLTLAIGGAVFLGAVNLRASVVGSVRLLFDAQRFDMALRFARPQDTDSVLAAVRGVPGVAGAEAWLGARASLDRSDGALGTTFPLTGAPIASRMLVLAPERGRWLRDANFDELVVNRRMLEEEPGMTPGSVVALLIGGRRGAWTVVGVVETGPSPQAYVAREALERATGSRGSTAVVVRSSLAGAASQLDLLQRLRAALNARGLDVTSGQLMAQQRKVVEDHLLMVAGFLGSMSLLMIVVGGLGLASTMSLAVLERTREIGVLRAIGARHGAIFGMVQAEGLVIGLLSWAIALPLSVPMSVALGKAFGRIMLRVPVTYVPQASGVVRWLVVVVVVSVVACAWPAWRALRVPAARALAYE